MLKIKSLPILLFCFLVSKKKKKIIGFLVLFYIYHHSLYFLYLLWMKYV